MEDVGGLEFTGLQLVRSEGESEFKCGFESGRVRKFIGEWNDVGGNIAKLICWNMTKFHLLQAQFSHTTPLYRDVKLSLCSASRPNSCAWLPRPSLI